MVRKIIITFASEIWYNPKQAWELFKMLGGALISGLIGALCWGCVECYEKVLDKLKR